MFPPVQRIGFGVEANLRSLELELDEEALAALGGT